MSPFPPEWGKTQVPKQGGLSLLPLTMALKDLSFHSQLLLLEKALLLSFSFFQKDDRRIQDTIGSFLQNN